MPDLDTNGIEKNNDDNHKITVIKKTTAPGIKHKKKIVVKKASGSDEKTGEIETNNDKPLTEVSANNLSTPPSNIDKNIKTTQINSSDIKDPSTEKRTYNNTEGNTGGYNNNQPRTYNNTGSNTGGYNNNQPRTYNNTGSNTGGYNNNQPRTYNNTGSNTGGYNNQPRTYNNTGSNTGGYNNQPRTYNNTGSNTGGYNNNQPRTYNNTGSNTGGYNNNQPRTYNNTGSNTGGYNNNQPRTYNNTGSNTGGYNRDANSTNTNGTFPPRRPYQGGAPGQQQNRPYGTGAGGYQGNRNDPAGNRGPINRGGPKPETTTTSPTNDKDRSRKKINQKKDIGKNKSYIENRPNDFEKNFVYRKKEKILVNSIPETIDIIDVITISDLAKKMNLKASIIISKLMELGSMFTINDKIDAETATIVASEFNCKINIVSLFDETVIEEETVEDSDLIKRPPIVTVMGHVDHGKTKLLDAIRHADIASSESGGITQHIGAYNVTMDTGEIITFIDTPGHEAFTMMRARGAQVTDIVILVVAADDGVMPQTIEAINHAKLANVPVIVAINKIDKVGANIDKIKQQLSEYALLPEEWGGHTMYCEISALKKIGIKELLETVLLQAEVLDLKASIKVRPIGFVIESRIDQGRGVVASILVSKGILKVGDYFVAGIYNGKVRAMYNDRGKKIKLAGPSIPVEITGLEFVPNAGDPFNVTPNEKESKLISAKRKELNKMEDAKSVKKLTLQDFMSQKKPGEMQEIKVIIKADVQGSAEAIKDSLDKLSNSEIRLVAVHTGVGAINETDVMLAMASKAIIIGFHVRPNVKAQSLAEKERVEIKRYNIIYDVIEDIKASMEGMIKPDLMEELIGNIDVKQIFKISKVGTIAGCIVTSGKVKRKSMIRLIREDVVIFSGKLSSLMRYKDEASEVFEGMECGISLENYKDIKTGDSMEVYEIKEISRNLLDIEKKELQEIEDKKIADLKEKKKKEDEEAQKIIDAEAKKLEE